MFAPEKLFIYPRIHSCLFGLYFSSFVFYDRDLSFDHVSRITDKQRLDINTKEDIVTVGLKLSPARNRMPRSLITYFTS